MTTATTPDTNELYDYLEYLAYRGACDRYGCDPLVFEDLPAFVGAEPPEHVEEDIRIRERIDLELGVIRQAGFPGYFLIVADLLRFCRDSGIPTGPGRGSVCGSAVAYATGITDVDPLRWGIPFERFLHLERVAMPDVDLDVCQARRGEVIEYLRDTYGRDNVAQIITFAPMQARSVIRDVCRVLHVDDLRGTRNGESGEELSKLVPEGSGTDQIKLAEYLVTDEGQALGAIIKPLAIDYAGGKVSVLDTCLRLEGIRKHSGVHAAGVVIADRPLIELVPLYRKNRDAEVQTQFDMRDVEKVGLLKMDVLGLRTVTVIGDAEKMVREIDPDFSIKDVPLTDAPTFRLLQAGDTGGVFQLEGEGITNAIIGIVPDRFEDLVAMNALYRPGPMEQIGEYKDRKHGKRFDYPHPDLEPVLSSTYGLMVYQEQVMGIARVLAGYTPGEADMFRKAIGKKLPELIRAEIEKFTERASANGYDSHMLIELGRQIAYFGRYGFNLGHATGYSYLTYWTAYLKANHPTEWYTALLNSYVDKAAEMGVVLREARKRGMRILPPDINESGRLFTIADEGSIRFGLEAVKSVGAGVVVDILEERDSEIKNRYVVERVQKYKDDGKPFTGSNRKVVRVPNTPRPYDSPADFCRRLPGVPINVKQALAIAGAFGTDKEYRRRLHEALPALNKAAKAGKAFDVDAWEGDTMSDLELIRAERETVGFYVTGHPLDVYADQLEMYDAITDGDFDDLRSLSTIAGLVLDVRTHQSSRGEMAWVKVENGIQGMPDVTIFSDVWRPIKGQVVKNAVLVVKGRKDVHPKFGVGYKAEMVTVVGKSLHSAKLIRVVLPGAVDETDIEILASFLTAAKGPVWHVAVHDGKRGALLMPSGRAILTGAMASAMQEMGWVLQLDPDRSARIEIDGAVYVASDQVHGEGGKGRTEVWNYPLVRMAHETLDAKIIGELRPK